MSIFKTILDLILAIFGVVPKAPDERDKERDAGVLSGKAQVEADNAKVGLREVTGAVAAGESEAAAVAADPKRLQRDGAPVRPFDPSGVE